VVVAVLVLLAVMRHPQVRLVLAVLVQLLLFLAHQLTMLAVVEVAQQMWELLARVQAQLVVAVLVLIHLLPQLLVLPI
jgi:hypothetical protein